jgi:hypothetical protein
MNIDHSRSQIAEAESALTSADSVLLVAVAEVAEAVSVEVVAVLGQEEIAAGAVVLEEDAPAMCRAAKLLLS